MVDSSSEMAAAVLRERAPAWAVVDERHLPSDAVESATMLAELVNTGSRIRSGRELAFSPAGSFEICVSVEGGVASLYAHYVSERVADADALARWDVPFAEMGDLMCGTSGLLGSRLPRPTPLVMAFGDEPPFILVLVDPDEQVVALGEAEDAAAAWHVVRAVNARLDGNIPEDFLSTPAVRSAMEAG